jgi:IMP dehydrogenase
MHRHRIEKLPVLDRDGATLIGLYTLKDIVKARKFPNASKDRAGRLLVGAAIGAGVRVASQEPPLYAQHTSSFSVSVNTPKGYTVKMYQSSNPMLGPLDFLTNSLNAVSSLGELAPEMMFISSQDQIGH